MVAVLKVVVAGQVGIQVSCWERPKDSSLCMCDTWSPCSRKSFKVSHLVITQVINPAKSHHSMRNHSAKCKTSLGFYRTRIWDTAKHAIKLLISVWYKMTKVYVHKLGAVLSIREFTLCLEAYTRGDWQSCNSEAGKPSWLNLWGGSPQDGT